MRRFFAACLMLAGALAAVSAVAATLAITHNRIAVNQPRTAGIDLNFKFK